MTLTSRYYTNREYIFCVHVRVCACFVLYCHICWKISGIGTVFAQRGYCYDHNPFNFFSGTRHYDDVIMTMLASQITSLTVVYSIVYSGVNQRRHQSSASLAFVWEIHRGPVNFPHKWPVTRKMFPFDDVIMISWPPTISSLTQMAQLLRKVL